MEKIKKKKKKKPSRDVGVRVEMANHPIKKTQGFQKMEVAVWKRKDHGGTGKKKSKTC